VGELEAVWKTGHVGIGFEGVTVGSDIDLGYSDILRTGVYALIRIAATSAVALDFHSGYHYERMRVNIGDRIERTLLPQELSFHWGTDHFRGEVRASVGINPDALRWDALTFEAGTSFEVRFGNVLGFVPGIGVSADFSHDPLREAFGLAANSFTGAIYLDLSWEPGFLRIGHGNN
ncbi:MAG TPA: hypothetical protein VJB16_05380, partial [archaeon]|nr:hypothetical protein [archaeon]